MIARPLQPPRTARAMLALPVTLLALAGCDGASAEARTRDVATPVVQRDTATLSAGAVDLAGLALAPAESLTWSDAWTLPARVVLDPAATQTLGAIAEGRIARVDVRPGDPVRAGQVLVALHSHEMMDARRSLDVATAAASEASTALSLAESAAARAQRLYDLRALSLADLERARGALAGARARRAQANAELERALAMVDHLVGGSAEDADPHEVLVRAPFDGVVVARDAQPGAVALIGAPLLSVSRAGALLLSIDVPERAIAAAVPGAAVSFTTAAFPGDRFRARVVRVAPVVDSLTRTLELLATVLDGTERLRAEMVASAELLSPGGARTLVVPASAVQAFDGDTVVVTAEDRAGGTLLEARRVRVGRRTGTRAEILAGLDAGVLVVSEGAAIAKAEILRRRTAE